MMMRKMKANDIRALGECGTVSWSQNLSLRVHFFLPLTYVLALGKSVTLTGSIFFAVGREWRLKSSGCDSRGNVVVLLLMVVLC